MVTLIAVALFVAALVSREVAQSLEMQWQGLSRWYSIIPVAGLLIYRMMRANYAHYENLARQTASLEKNLEEENNRLQQPDVVLIWDWTDQEKGMLGFLGNKERSIIVSNRSDHSIARVLIQEEAALQYPVTFDEIHDIPPKSAVAAIGRWDVAGANQSTVSDSYNHHIVMNSDDLEVKGFIKPKPHNRGISSKFVEVPLSVSFSSRDTRWKIDFDLHYDPQDNDSYFIRKRCSRVA